jgi:hypothetical protein
MPLNDRTRLIATLCLWSGRILALGLGLFWLTFFVEHLGEWFLQPGQPWPPARVVVAVGFHGLMILGLAVGLVRPVPGVALLALSTAGFLAATGLWRVPWIPVVNAVPAILLLLGDVLPRQKPQSLPNPLTAPDPGTR